MTTGTSGGAGRPGTGHSLDSPACGSAGSSCDWSGAPSSWAGRSARSSCWWPTGPGGPLDLLVGLTMLVPVAIAVAGLVWPPVARGSGAFPLMVWLGIVALLCLVPSIIGIVDLLQTSASSSLVPSPEAAYPWLIALAATSLFSGLGIARHLRGGAAVRRRRFIDGALIGTALTVLSATIFASAALANAAAIRETVPTTSRFGPTDPTGQPPPLRRSAGGGPDRDPRRDARRRGRPAPDRLDRPRRRPRRHGLPLERVRRDGPRARLVGGDPPRPRGMGPEPGPAVGHRGARRRSTR